MPQSVSQGCGVNYMQLCVAKANMHEVITIISNNKDKIDI